MSGPPYPEPLGAGSNAIGTFEIGVSPIGDIPQFNPWDTIISQYSNSPILTALILKFAEATGQVRNLDAFFDNIWNIDSAQGLGLDIWGRIVGVSRTLEVTVGGWFGFAEASPGSEGFGQAAFYSGSGLTSNYNLVDDAYRQLILAKAAANITDGSIPAINRILMTLFPNRGNAYVTEGTQIAPFFGFAESTNANGFEQAPFYSGQSISTMTMTYTFNFTLSPVELAIVQNSGVLPKPVGVKATVVVNP